MIRLLILLGYGVLMYFWGKVNGYNDGYKNAKYDIGYSTKKPKDMNYGKNA